MRAGSGAACTFHLHPRHPISNVRLQAAALRAQLAEQEEELAGLGEGLGGLERENSNLEAQVGAVCGFVFVTGATHGSCLQTGTGPGGLRVSNLEAKAPPCARVALVDGGVCPRRNRHLQVDQVTQALIETQAAKAQLERRVAELEQVIQYICVFPSSVILLLYGVSTLAPLEGRMVGLEQMGLLVQWPSLVSDNLAPIPCLLTGRGQPGHTGGEAGGGQGGAGAPAGGGARGAGRAGVDCVLHLASTSRIGWATAGAPAGRGAQGAGGLLRFVSGPGLCRGRPAGGIRVGHGLDRHGAAKT